MKLRQYAKEITTALGIFAFIGLVASCTPTPENPLSQPTPTPKVVINTPPPIPSPTVSSIPQAPPVKPEKLIEIIKREQEDNVRESCAEDANSCFTDLDLNRFIKGKVPDQITARLKKDNEFIGLVRLIKAMPSSERQQLLKKGENTGKKTWKQLGRVICEGQTDAGQKAERMIAVAIVKLVKDLIKLP